MTSPADLREKLWKSLKSDRTLMLGLAGVDEGHGQPMTAQFDGDDTRAIWIFTSRDTDLAQALGARHEAVAHFIESFRATMANDAISEMIQNSKRKD